MKVTDHKPLPTSPKCSTNSENGGNVMKLRTLDLAALCISYGLMYIATLAYPNPTLEAKGAWATGQFPTVNIAACHKRITLHYAAYHGA